MIPELVESPCKSEFYYIDKYRADSEDEKTIEKTMYRMSLFKHLDKLFEMVAEDVANGGDDIANISIASIHPSQKSRRLIDLQQSLHITAAFEFYVRRYLPVMSYEYWLPNTNGKKEKHTAEQNAVIIVAQMVQVKANWVLG